MILLNIWQRKPARLEELNKLKTNKQKIFLIFHRSGQASEKLLIKT
jgi:hypothetical protein